MTLYRDLLRPLLFRLDAERAHALAIGGAEVAGSMRACREAAHARLAPSSSRLAIEVAGLRMRSPLGLAAGFDKSGRAVSLLSAFSFGHVEIGSVSASSSAGNPSPRLFRIPRDRGIVVNYGLPNDGASRVAQRLAQNPRCAPVGANVVSTNHGPNSAPVSDDAVIADYVQAVGRLQPHCDYLCLNLSCPNTREGRGFFDDRQRLRELLAQLGALGIVKPLFLKVAPFADVASLGCSC